MTRCYGVIDVAVMKESRSYEMVWITGFRFGVEGTASKRLVVQLEDKMEDYSVAKSKSVAVGVGVKARFFFKSSPLTITQLL